MHTYVCMFVCMNRTHAQPNCTDMPLCALLTKYFIFISLLHTLSFPPAFLPQFHAVCPSVCLPVCGAANVCGRCTVDSLLINSIPWHFLLYASLFSLFFFHIFHILSDAVTWCGNKLHSFCEFAIIARQMLIKQCSPSICIVSKNEHPAGFIFKWRIFGHYRGVRGVHISVKYN